MLSHMECNSRFDMNYEYIGTYIVTSQVTGTVEAGGQVGH